jgi:hypothetical protein
MLTILGIATLVIFGLYLKQNDYYRRLIDDLTAKHETDQEKLQAQLTAANTKIAELSNRLAAHERENKNRSGVLSVPPKPGTPGLPATPRKRPDVLSGGKLYH